MKEYWITVSFSVLNGRVRGFHSGCVKLEHTKEGIEEALRNCKKSFIESIIEDCPGFPPYEEDELQANLLLIHLVEGPSIKDVNIKASEQSVNWIEAYD